MMGSPSDGVVQLGSVSQYYGVTPVMSLSDYCYIWHTMFPVPHRRLDMHHDTSHAMGLKFAFMHKLA